MLLSAVMCAKPLRHRNVNIKLYINQIYLNTIIHAGVLRLFLRLHAIKKGGQVCNAN